MDDLLKDLFKGKYKIKHYLKGIYIFLDAYEEIPYERLADIAKNLKKRIFVRLSENARLPKDKTIEILKSYFRNIDGYAFLDAFGEIVVRIRDLNLKPYENLRNAFLKQTGWYLEFERSPSIDTEFSKKIFIQKYNRESIKNPKKVEVLDKVDNVKHILLTMLGGFQEVGRTCMLLETEYTKVLIDLGINPSGGEELPYLKYLPPLEEIDAIILSHAHADHSAGIPYLYRAGYDGPIYMTEPTLDLTTLIQNDYLNLAEKRDNAIYDHNDIKKMIDNAQVLEYQQTIDIGKDLKLTFYNAGHILGSSIVHINVADKYVFLFSGDIKYGETHLFDPAFNRFPQVNSLVIESTYGTTKMPDRAESENLLINKIKEVINRGGKVLIPVFAVGRSQEILLTIYNKKTEDWNIPIYIDGMINEALSIHTTYLEYLKKDIRQQILQGLSPFNWDMIKIVKSKDKSSILKEPSIIMATSGMMTGGPVLEYLRLLAEDEKSALIFVGYQAPGTLGSKIQQGIKTIPMRINGDIKEINIKMEVVTIEGFSGHSDQDQLINWINGFRTITKKIYTMHGDQAVTLEFAKKLKNIFKTYTDAPTNMERRRLK